MKSMTEVKKVIGKGLAAAALAAAVFAVPSHAGVVAGGSVPLENWFQAEGVDGLDVTAANTATTVASIWLNNNAPNSFVLTVTQRNGGFLKAGLAAANPVVASGTGNPFSAVCNIVDGAAQAAGAVWGPTAAFAPDAFDVVTTGGLGTMSPGAALVATENYRIDIDATWALATGMLAGHYTEVFTVSLVAVM